MTCAAPFGALSERFIRGRNTEHDALGFGAPHAIGNRTGFFRAFSPLLRIVQQIHFQTNRCGKNVGQSAAPTVIWNTDPICQCSRFINKIRRVRMCRKDAPALSRR